MVLKIIELDHRNPPMPGSKKFRPHDNRFTIIKRRVEIFEKKEPTQNISTLNERPLISELFTENV